MDRYRIITARHFGVLLYGMVWLAGIIILQPYLGKASSLKQMLLRFAWVAAAQAAVWGIGWGVQELFMS